MFKSHLFFKRTAAAVQIAELRDSSLTPLCTLRGWGGAPAAMRTSNRIGVSRLRSSANNSQLNNWRSLGIKLLSMPFLRREQSCSHSSRSCFGSNWTTMGDTSFHFVIVCANNCRFPLHRASVIGQRNKDTSGWTGFSYNSRPYVQGAWCIRWRIRRTTYMSQHNY